MSPTAKLFCCLMFVTFLKSDYRVTPSSPDDFPFHQPRKLNQLSHGRLCAVQQPVVGCAHAHSKDHVCVRMWAVPPACRSYPAIWLSAVSMACLRSYSVIRSTASLHSYLVIRSMAYLRSYSVIRSTACLHSYSVIRGTACLRSYTVIRGTGCCAVTRLSVVQAAAQLHSYPWYRLPMQSPGYPQYTRPVCTVTQLSVVWPACTVTWLSVITPACAVTRLSGYLLYGLPAQLPSYPVICYQVIRGAACLRSYSVIRGTACLHLPAQLP